jgi:predicted glycoside hydrolase/deacetylase ChbG (UPF0249 family)
MTAALEPAMSQSTQQGSAGAGSIVILCADDHAMSEGVSRGIAELAAARRLSAASVLVTTPRWPADASGLLPHRGHLSIGLHLNLTLGRPLGPMPRLAPSGAFAGVGSLAMRAWLGRLEESEVRDEIERQLDRFEQGLRFPPDHVDGHQHVQALPGVRRALIKAVAKRYPSRPPLIRVPAGLRRALAGAGRVRAKAAAVSLLALGFAGAVSHAGLPANDSFAGFSRFDVKEPYAAELRDALRDPGRRHLVMCHPGHPDAELERLDPVVTRRGMEYEVLMREPDLPELIWHASRAPDGPAIDWASL